MGGGLECAKARFQEIDDLVSADAFDAGSTCRDQDPDNERARIGAVSKEAGRTNLPAPPVTYRDQKSNSARGSGASRYGGPLLGEAETAGAADEVLILGNGIGLVAGMIRGRR